MSAALHILAFAVLFVPTIWELWDDRNGEDKQGKLRDRYKKGIVWAVSTFVSLVIYFWPVLLVKSSGAVLVGWWTLKSWIMALAIHFLIFDYAIVIILKHRGVIETKESAFSYLGKTANYPKFWVKMNPWIRFCIRLTIFAIALIIYNIWTTYTLLLECQ